MKEINKGDIVICIINSLSSLTVGKEYEVTDTYTDYICVRCDEDYEMDYNKKRFVLKSDFRELKINNILKNE